MKKVISIFLLAVVVMVSAESASAQAQLAPDQNPDYMVSQTKYMGMADSLNAWHSTTPQETYKAIDYLADKKEARELRRAYRMQRAANTGWYNYGYNYYSSYNYPYYYGRNNFLWNTLPWTLTGSYHWHRSHWR